MRTGVLILPEKRWARSARTWRTFDELGYDSLWTYDHLSWRSLEDGPWFSSFPVLAAAAVVTSRATLGTLVTSPNFRHPVGVAKDAIALDDISGGRFVLGIGAGSADAGDSNVLAQETFSRRERTERFEEFVQLTDELLRNPVTTFTGAHFSAYEARTIPGCVQRPRLPVAIAATGPRGLALAAQYSQAWVTTGPTDWARGFTPKECLDAVAAQVVALRAACDRVGGDFNALDRIFVVTDPAGDFLSTPDVFLKMAERYAKAGITHLVLHAPREEGVYAADPEALHHIAADALPAVRAM
ncbi:LLM class flavin-dependent oxidoreductase [Streptomyces olivaceus]|uniref:LLM class flavin-dependent oxidoreductase n=1 Tax=Streptomyces olivaceus TaxID=47716 RepID=A0ABS7WGS7_STROV|nr:LLM class flavin-dependent oxidoreductase [Streptomyces olivaceus]MBZ6093497.1 LLM class flavin-dependent oxidoreductase [Streptomyces olivaceus]MBZ6100430.1 LLM class flavin-dependent oxidoreductase [Streptomyces olivaceus]MBZ6121594.1 LLM class flavin-dependent oxidoreductase [Streptomyces olivaceus]MBZ6156330.1 LLM class flavin-dependent oxidoreductase [Streptomyces olivaceus]MBZ6302856.1 LLM class flavin-dependent oxidoreductase [Streptomyces olivaceus]